MYQHFAYLENIQGKKKPLQICCAASLPLIYLVKKAVNSKLSVHHANISFPLGLEQSVLEAFTR